MKVRQAVLYCLLLALKNISYKRYLNRKKTNLLTYAAGMLLISSTPAVAEDCQTMLQPYFDWENQVGNYDVYPVYATLTMHSLGGLGYSTKSTANAVEYGHGQVTSKTEASYLIGTVAGYLNSTSPPFKSLPQLTYALKVSQTGLVSVSTRINGKYFLGQPPVVFQGSCSNGLITGLVNGKSYALSFRNRPGYDIIK